LEVIQGLARLGVRETTLMGGEAYLRSDWLGLIEALRDAGIAPTLLTGGRGLSRSMVADMARAGIAHLGVSIDGPPALHDRMHGVDGSYQQALQVLRWARELELPATVNTNLTPACSEQLSELLEPLIDAGASSWRIGLVTPSGRAAEHEELIVQPYELLGIMPLVAELHWEGAERNLLVQWDDGMGYFGPYEHLLRSGGDEPVWWQGCHGGINALGVQSNGAVKPCTSLPSDYAGGHATSQGIDELWQESPEMAFARTRTQEELWGFCGSCYYGAVCRAGCTWASHALFGRRGNNPLCHHRALELERQGLRERLVRTGVADEAPYAHGSFEVRLESSGGQERSAQKPPRDGTTSRDLQKLWSEAHADSALVLCRGCHRHVFAGTKTCPHCECDVTDAQRDYDRRYREALRARDDLAASLASLTSDVD
jgi:radical SAM protein with 4Fe4S-binding SPASM domain